MSRDDNIAVFKDTERLCKLDSKIKDSVKKSVSAQKLIPETDELPETDLNKYENKAEVTVSGKRTYEAASAYRDCRVAVLNFASASNPGGGVVTGAGAQEECLCRCSGLYFCLNTPGMWEGFYTPHRNAHNPLHNDDIIYTPDVCVFKTDTDMPGLMPESEWYSVDVISCAAPNLREKTSNKYNSGDGSASVKITDKNLLMLHEKRLRRILDVAVMNDDDTVILGAFGCGAFLNNPEIVAQASRNVLKDYLHAFKNIEYAVYCRPNDDSNYRTFKRVLGVYTK